MSRVVAVVQGRMGSERLPGKLLAPIDGVALLARLVESTRDARVEEWWLATTTLPEDEAAVEAARRLGLRTFRGSQSDVLSRYAEVARRSGADIVVRITGDNPFTTAQVVDSLLDRAFDLESADVVSDRGEQRLLPLGYCPELVRADALLEAAARELPAHHRAHVTSWLYETTRGAHFEPPPDWPARPGWRWTVDTAADLAMADAAFAAFRQEGVGDDYQAMVACLDAHPEIVGLNAAVRQKAVAEG
jgi:spore coat polysaccharide biosynthesis protein SpsF